MASQHLVLRGPQIGEKKEDDAGDASHGEHHVPPQLLPNDLVRLPGRVDLGKYRENEGGDGVLTLTKEKAVASPDLLSTSSTALLAGTCSSGPSNGRYSIENLRGFLRS